MQQLLLRASDTDVSLTGRRVSGLAIPYGQTDTVSDGGPAYQERWVNGCCARTIAERSGKIQLWTQHDSSKLAIGKASRMEESTDGLFVEFTVSSTRDGLDALRLIRDDVVTGLSVGFTPIRERKAADGAIERLEIAIREISLVNAPALAGSGITAIRDASTRLFIPATSARNQIFLLEN